ncbi:MAG TPA: ATP-binding protein, partial [Phycisphaerales bacterium]|nr:ATP-binding protein [Phycisphaerales bacterium]
MSEQLHSRITLKNTPQEIEAAETDLLNAVEQASFDRASCFAIRLAVEEALANAFKHGNQGDAAKSVTLQWSVEPDMVHIDIQDEGTGFDPTSVPDPTDLENLDIPSGRGLMLMRAYMTRVEIIPPGNRVHMVYQR